MNTIAAGQHQSHESGIRENVAEPAGQAVIDRTEHGGDFAEALGIAAGTVDQHQNADAQHDRHAADVADLEHIQRKSRKQDQPCALVEDRVADLALTALHDHVHDHAGRELDETEHHGADEDLRRIGQRVE